MAHSLSSRRRASAYWLTLALAALSCTVGGSLAGAPAVADTAPAAGVPPTVSADPLPTVQIDGVAWDQVVVGNTVYVTGSFAFARPAGTAANSTQRVARANLLAYDIRTGNLIPGFNHTLNAQGRQIVASPDGTRIYVGGSFTSVDGVAHNRLIAFDTATGALVAGFNPNLNNTVLALAATNSTVYVGGSFSTASGQARARLAAYTSAGAITAWNPGTDSTVTSMTLAPDQSRVVVGGGFLTLAGQSRFGIGSVLANGTAGPWDPNFPIRDTGSSSNIQSLVSDGTNVYGAGYYFTTGGNFEGRFAANPYTGTLVWMNTCHGDSYDVTVIGQVLYSASHHHDCSDIGSFSQNVGGATASDHYYVAAETTFATGRLHKPIIVGGAGQPGPRYFDFSGQPSGTRLDWTPVLTVGSYTGQTQSAWSVAGNASYLSVGGEFPTANGTAQQGLVRYAVRALAPNRIGPAGVTAPTAVSQTSGTVRVGWRAASDQDNAALTYQLYRDGGATPIHTEVYSGAFWNRPVLSYNDTGLAPGTTHSYRVRVTDPTGNTVLSTASANVTVGTAATPSYTDTVRADSPDHFWRLSESSGSNGADWAGAADLTLSPGASFAGVAGPIAGNGTAATFSGVLTTTTTPSPFPGGPPQTRVSSTSVAATAGDIVPLSSYTLEAWVRTSSTTGGVVLSDSVWTPGGDPSNPNRTSAAVDRVLYFANDGTVRFGVTSDNTFQTIGSTSTYNNGAWHHLAATLGSSGATLYVDGAQVAANPALNDNAVFVGHWRVGGDSLAGWTPTPTSGYLTANIADVAVYPTVLAPARIHAHFAAAGGGVVNVPPTNNAFGSDAFGRTVATGFGTADVGGAWTTSPSNRYSVGGNAGAVNLATGGFSGMAFLGGVSSSSTDLTLSLALDKVPNATAFLDVIGRRVTANQEYDGLVKITSSGAVQLNIRKLNGSTAATDLATTVGTGLTYTAGSRLNVRMQVQGTSPTTVRLKVWPATGTEPANWAVTVTDSSVGLQAAGGVGLRTFLASGATNTPIVETVRNLVARAIG